MIQTQNPSQILHKKLKNDRDGNVYSKIMKIGSRRAARRRSDAERRRLENFATRSDADWRFSDAGFSPKIGARSLATQARFHDAARRRLENRAESTLDWACYSFT